MKMNINLIVAHTFKKTPKGEYGIGIKNKLPWSIKEDLINFKNITTLVPNDKNIKYFNVVVMGRKTWESLPLNFKPLPNRINVVISNQDIIINNKNVIVSKWEDFENHLINYQNKYNSEHTNENIMINEIFIIGGQQIYNLALKTRKINKLYITEVYKNIQCDTYINDYLNKEFINTELNDFALTYVSKFNTSEENNYRFMTYYNVKNYDDVKILNQDILWCNKEEMNYLNVMREILENGIEREDRTGTGTISTFGNQLKFNLRDTFPISTTKRMFLRGIFEELKLYLTGKTDNKILQEKNIHIWDGNTSREFLDKRGLTHYPEGDMGETYGFNMRHYGGKYEGCDKNYDNTVGFDQLEYVIDLLKNNPTSRRIIINLWNPATQENAALPSCLCQYQFYVNTQSRELSLQIYIRSSDYFLANNWNTCTGALFVHMLCNVNGINFTPGDLSVVIGDTHLYKTHLEQVKENLMRKPYPFPMLKVKKSVNDITEFEFEDFELIGYRAYPRIAADMSV
jgi:dihydrofolate reductase/thymidylate synthase